MNRNTSFYRQLEFSNLRHRHQMCLYLHHRHPSCFYLHLHLTSTLIHPKHYHSTTILLHTHMDMILVISRLCLLNLESKEQIFLTLSVGMIHSSLGFYYYQIYIPNA